MPAATHLTSEFLAHKAHELRTPLNSIIGFAELMRDGKVGPVSAEHCEYLGDILTSAAHLLELINELLDMARLEAGRLDQHPVPVDIAGLVTEVVETKRAQADRKHLRVDIDIAPDLSGILLDPTRLKQVLCCYLDNALIFTPEGGRVIVYVRPEGAEAFRLEAEASGIDIRPEDLQQLFGEVCPARRQPGASLGLGWAARIVELQGGRVGVRSIPGQGSTFFAVLPRDASRREEPGN
jgi:signal transduction histidine kinase